MGSIQKSLVLMGCTPIAGHLAPVREVAKALIARGYLVTFVSAQAYEKTMRDIGCDYVALDGNANFTNEDFDTIMPERAATPPGPAQIELDMRVVFIQPIPEQYAAMQRAMRMLQEKHPGRPIVQIYEGMFQGALPGLLGAPGIKPAGIIGMGVLPMFLNSVDCAPVGPGLPPATTAEDREKYAIMKKQINEQFFGTTQKLWESTLSSLGAQLAGDFFLDAMYTRADRFLQMCPPSAEYPRSDAPSTIIYAGCLPKRNPDAGRSLPKWWHEVKENEGKKDIVFVCQGTIVLDDSLLNIPTMAALEDRPNTLVVVALGRKDAALPQGTHVPTNARVADFIYFDEILPYCSVFVTNGGYGAFQHGISNGVPMIMAGATEDKPEVSMRAEWAGLAVNLRTGTPTKEAIREAVDEIAANPKYKIRAKEMQAEAATCDPVGVMAETIEFIGAGKHLL